MALNPVTIHAIENLQRLTELFSQRREQLALEVGLSVAQWQLLEEISEEHFMPSMFARRQDSTPANVSKLIRQLLDKGIITVGISEIDGRQRRYSLTESGIRTMEKLRESRQQAIDAIWSGFSHDELAVFSNFSDRLAEQLEAYAAGRGEKSRRENGAAVAAN